MSPDRSTDRAVHRIYAMLTGDGDRRIASDLPASARAEQPGNFVKHVVSLAATKTGDGLADPKLVLSWLLTQLGAPATAIGWLVPVREAGALLPQLGISAWIRARPLRKRVWAAGSAVQGLAVLGMAAAATTLEGSAAGWTLVGLLAVFAIARSACSVSHKDVLGKTVAKATRGTATGTAGTLASAAVFAFGAALATGVLPTTVATVVGGLCVAGGLWLVAATTFLTLAEDRSPRGDDDGSSLRVVFAQLDLLRTDAELRRFLATRGLLIATALAPPYVLQLAGGAGAANGAPALGQLGAFVIASSSASVLSSYVWGRLSDRSSRRVLMLAGAVGAVALGTTGALALWDGELLRGPLLAPALLLVLMTGYQGVRIGRATHIVDMADERTRAAYTAVSNTVIGVLLTLAGGFGLLAQVAGAAVVLLVFAAMCGLSIVTARGMREVQRG